MGSSNIQIGKTFCEVKSLGRSNFQRRSQFWGGQNFREVKISGKLTFGKSKVWGGQNVWEVNMSGRSKFWKGQYFGEVKLLARSTFWGCPHFGGGQIL